MQLYICQYGIWNDDGECRICVVLFASYKPYRVHRSFSVCPDYIFKQWGIIVTIAVTALLMNSRQSFYSLSFLETFRKMGRKKFYMIHTMTDETYAVNCTIEDKDENSRKEMFLVAFFSRCYWMFGAVMGGLIGQLIPFELNGIDFCMTALFIIIFIDQWEKADKHFPAITGILIAVIALLIFGQTAFMLPALVIVSGVLIFWNSKQQEV